MAERKKKTSLSMSEKFQILQEIKNGVPRQEIINKYNISERLCRKIVQHTDEIITKNNDFEFRNRKAMKSVENPKLEAAVLKWFIQKRDSGQPVSATMLQEKARMFNEMLKGSPNFKASNGWFFKFKKRHGLKKLSLKGEILSNDNNSTQEFVEVLNAKIMRENLKLENIYNAKESGIYWKSLLNYTFTLSTENASTGFKENKDRFTALFCANASGSHRFPLLIIDKSPIPRDLKNLNAGKAKLHDINYLKKLDVTYSAQRSGWINCEIFKNWYEHEFISRVLEHQKWAGITEKVLLILDNASSHPSAEELNAINENFEVIFLPSSVTAIIQPMDQSPISTTKKNYKRNLMRRLLMETDYEKIETFLKELKLQDCLEMLRNGWCSMNQTTLQNAWKPLLRNLGSQKYIFTSTENPMYDEDSFSCEIYDSIKDSYPIYDFCEHLAKCLSKNNEEIGEISKNVKSKIEEWFDTDEGDNGWEILSDTQIVQSVFNGQQNFDDFETQNVVVDRTETNEAYEGFSKFKSWMMSHVKCSESQILHLKECENILRNAIDNNPFNTVLIKCEN